MKVVVVFGEENPKKEDMKKFEPLIDELLEKLPGDTDITWYLLEESKVESIEKEMEKMV